MTSGELLDALWRDCVAAAPQAEAIRYALAARGEILATDHIALRTFALPGLGAEALARPFEGLGWQRSPERAERAERIERAERAECVDRCDVALRTLCWQPPEPALPRLLISELGLDALSPAAQAVVRALVDQRPVAPLEPGERARCGRPWRLRYADYQTLLAESDHAAWVAAFGASVDHFTIDVAALPTFPDLAALDAFLVEHGFDLDERGGAIKGSPAARIEHSATRPDRIVVEFDEASVRLASSYCELVRRYPASDERRDRTVGQLLQRRRAVPRSGERAGGAGTSGLR